MTGRLLYTLFMLLAVAVYLTARHYTPKPADYRAIPWRKRAVLALVAFVGGALGAKLPFAVVSADGWWSPLAWVSDGKTIVAGLIGAYLAVEAAKLVMGVRVKTGDTFALPLALAMTVGRWGCFCNGCCYGVPTDLPWGVAFRNEEGGWARCHPTQIYESLFHLLMATALFQMTLYNLLPGRRLKFYFIAYAIYRFLTEFIRPEPPWHLGLTFYQWAALVLLVGLTVQWIVEARNAPVEPLHGSVAATAVKPGVALSAITGTPQT
jgi:phosphatidylglycerol:prolipoprotein diacylglycerol transferase